MQARKIYKTITNVAFAIPKASSLAHVRENAAAADIVLSAEALAAIDAEFAPSRRAVSLAML